LPESYSTHGRTVLEHSLDALTFECDAHLSIWSTTRALNFTRGSIYPRRTTVPVRPYYAGALITCFVHAIFRKRCRNYSKFSHFRLIFRTIHRRIQPHGEIPREILLDSGTLYLTSINS